MTISLCGYCLRVPAGVDPLEDGRVGGWDAAGSGTAGVPGPESVPGDC